MPRARVVILDDGVKVMRSAGSSLLLKMPGKSANAWHGNSPPKRLRRTSPIISPALPTRLEERKEQEADPRVECFLHVLHVPPILK